MVELGGGEPPPPLYLGQSENRDSGWWGFRLPLRLAGRAHGGQAYPGGIVGEGIEGGVYSLRLIEFDSLTVIVQYRASTSHENLFEG